MITNEHFLDFVYIGAPRAGSTWLAAALSEHPQIWIPHNKELHFFNRYSLYPTYFSYPKGIDYYRQYFVKAPENALLGDISPLYYFDSDTAQRIVRHFPEVKIIALLRNPADVAFSVYLKRKTQEFRKPTFEQELKRDKRFIDLGYYFRQLKPYFDYFPRENIGIWIYEHFFDNQEESIKNVYHFLGVDYRFVPGVIGKKINAAKDPGPKIKIALNGLAILLLNTPVLFPIKNMLHKLKINKTNYSVSPGQRKPPKERLSEETRRYLMKNYEPDISHLEKLLNIDLGIWRAKLR
ncbi:MAG: hypothetical protein GF401_12870 [Chitinivibrionales bacterium]|nr:hypothetical protein [Chitinivibrionales bacterium]